MNEQPAVEARGLTRRYGEILAVDDLDLTIRPATIYALLGPNGAGKTTTISMLTTLLEPTDGTACVAGYDIVREAAEVRKHIGVTFQEIVLDKELAGREVLDYHAQLYGISRSVRHERIDELLALVELGEAADRKVKTYSGGMKRRLELARGLVTHPRVLFLDEPTQGLDPQNRTRVWDYLRSMRETHGITLVLTTHYMEEAEVLADNVGIIDHGRLVIEGTPEGLVEQMGANVINVQGAGNADAFVEKVRRADGVQSVHSVDGTVQLGVDDGNHRLPGVVMLAGEAGYHIDDISVSRPSLGDVFLRYTGRALRDV